MLGAGRREGKVIMTSQRVVGVLAVIALLGLSATGAEAGFGGKPTALTSFFLCKSINGDDAGLRVDVESSDPGIGWGTVLRGVRIGNATLACAFARLFPENTPIPVPCGEGQTPQNSNCNEITPTPPVPPTGDPLVGLQMKCYSVSVQRGQPGVPPPNYTTFDGLLGEDTNVSGSSTQYVCAPAKFTQ
jgi:hypothetical protein